MSFPVRVRASGRSRCRFPRIHARSLRSSAGSPRRPSRPCRPRGFRRLSHSFARRLRSAGRPFEAARFRIGFEANLDAPAWRRLRQPPCLARPLRILERSAAFSLRPWPWEAPFRFRKDRLGHGLKLSWIVSRTKRIPPVDNEDIGHK
jgi:hypothetical protein